LKEYLSNYGKLDFENLRLVVFFKDHDWTNENLVIPIVCYSRHLEQFWSLRTRFLLLFNNMRAKLEGRK